MKNAKRAAKPTTKNSKLKVLDLPKWHEFAARLDSMLRGAIVTEDGKEKVLMHVGKNRHIELEVIGLQLKTLLESADDLVAGAENFSGEAATKVARGEYLMPNRGVPLRMPLEAMELATVLSQNFTLRLPGKIAHLAASLDHLHGTDCDGKNGGGVGIVILISAALLAYAESEAPNQVRAIGRAIACMTQQMALDGRNAPESKPVSDQFLEAEGDVPTFNDVLVNYNLTDNGEVTRVLKNIGKGKKGVAA